MVGRQRASRRTECPRWISKLMESLNTPRALTVKLMIEHGEWDQLVGMTIDPHHYDDSLWGAEKFSRDLQAYDLLRKNRELPTSIDKERVALLSFYRSEQQCYRSNERLRLLRARLEDGFPETESGMRLHDFVRRCRKRVREILGKMPAALSHALRFGPGATYESKGYGVADVTIGDKITNMNYCTSEALPVFKHSCEGTALDKYQADWVQSIECTRGNRFTSVPKNAKTFRGICIEPGGNILCQLAVGSFLREALARAGINLDTGQALHSQLAGEGSLKGNWATIDLESASDTVCLELVKLLLPESWYDLLWSLRSPYTSVEGKWVRLEKFSSMGNGFTFELESLVFSVIAETAAGGYLGESVYVYGDDIIVPNASYHDVCKALQFFGFVPNSKKSFHTSPFRESCGGQYFNGVRVTTYKVEVYPSEISEWFSLHNGLSRYRVGLTTRSRLAIRDQIPLPFKRFRGPESLGDSVLWEEDETAWETQYNADTQSLRVRGIQIRVRVVELHHFKPDVVLTLALYGVPARGLSTRSCEGIRKRWLTPYGVNLRHIQKHWSQRG